MVSDPLFSFHRSLPMNFLYSTEKKRSWEVANISPFVLSRNRSCILMWTGKANINSLSSSLRPSLPQGTTTAAKGYLIDILKPWTNGVAIRRKLKTWIYLRLRLARPCVHLRRLAMTCAHLNRDQICTQVKSSFSSFGHPTQVIASWFKSINLLLANEIQDMSALKCFFATLLVQSLNSPFFPNPIGAEPGGRAKGESRITYMRMLRTSPFSSPKSGENHIWKCFPDSTCDAIFWMIIYKQQFLHSDW